ncbi:hypothetical protein LA6_003469 [Marinibacterium anthonyi]|nr:hypothetical protein LA6_003469 [Marinibacterium anthonyi]
MLKTLQTDFDRASRAYCDTHGFTRDADWYILKLQEEVGELTQAWNRLSGRARLKDVPAHRMHRDLEDEAADVLGHILLLAERHDLDLAAAIQRKWRFAPRDPDTPTDGDTTCDADAAGPPP